MYDLEEKKNTQQKTPIRGSKEWKTQGLIAPIFLFLKKIIMQLLSELANTDLNNVISQAIVFIYKSKTDSNLPKCFWVLRDDEDHR